MNQSLIFQTIAKYSEPWRKFHTTQHLGYLWKTYEEAEEWFSYNQIGAWVGSLTPCFLDNLEER
jgi:hypothetical protein